MNWKFVTIEKKQRVAVIRFDRGDNKNTLSFELMHELLEAAKSFEDDSETSAIILTGAGENFSLGFDLGDGLSDRLMNAGLAEKRKMLQIGPKLCQAFEDLEPLTLVAMEGWCVGGGAALVAACDLRIMGESAHLYVPEIERGMNMSWQSVPRITALVGPARAKRVIVLAERLDAQTCLQWGLADYLVDNGSSFDKAMQLAQRVAELPPVPVRMCKKGINVAANALNSVVSFMDVDQYLLAQGSEDYQEGVRSFLEKRPPQYKGR